MGEVIPIRKKPINVAQALDKMTTKKRITLYKPHAGQLKIHKSKARFRVVACGRRYGKTLFACNEIVKYALEHKTAECGWVAPTYRQSKLAYRLIRRALKDVITYKSDSELRLEFENGSSITFFSSDNYDAIRGNGFHFLVLDECADINEKAWNEVLRPALSDKRGKALMIGTPKGRNFFFRLFARGADPGFPDWAAFNAPSSDNPYMPEGEIETAKREMPEDTYQQEYMAVFLEESAGVFKGIDKCIRGDLEEDYQPITGHDYIAGWDVAKFQDYSVVTVLDCHTRELVAWKRFNQIDYKVQVEIVADIAEKFKSTVYMDSTGVGSPVAELLKAAGSGRGFQVEEYLFTNASKKVLVEKLQIAIQYGTIWLKNIEVLINELRIYEYQISPSRNLIYGAPKGAHDDAATSLMLANYGMSQPRGALMWSVEEYVQEELGRAQEKPKEDKNPRPVMEIEKLEMEEEWKEEGVWIEL